MGNTSDYITDEQAKALMAKMNYTNALVCEFMLETGYRIGDAVALERAVVERALQTGWITIVEEKTGKKRSVRSKRNLCERLLYQSGKKYVFENKRSPERHRQRSTVWAQIDRIASDENICVSPHSFRKNYAVRMFRESLDIEKVRRAMGHEYIHTTILYATSDVMTAAKQAKASRKRQHRKAV